MPEFKFQIGDLVCHRTDYHQAVRFCVTERIAQECPGGIQLQYKVNAIMTTGMLTTIFLEPELVEMVNRPRREKPADPTTPPS